MKIGIKKSHEMISYALVLMALLSDNLLELLYQVNGNIGHQSNLATLPKGL
jgi:hypothetical protein